MKNQLFINYKSIKNEAKSSIWVCYTLSLLPIITLLLSLIVGLFSPTKYNFLNLYSQYIYLLILFPLLFILIDVTMVIFGKRRFKFNLSEFLKRYFEIIPLALCLILIILASIIQAISSPTQNGFTTSVLSPFGIGLGFPIILLIAMCFVFGFGIKNRNIAEHILFAITISSTILCVLILIDPKCNFKIHNPSNDVWSSVFNNSNCFGLYLTIPTIILAGMFTFRKNKLVKFSSIFAFLLHCVVLFLTNTFSSMLGVFFALIFMAIFKQFYRKKFDPLALLPLAIFIGLSFAVQLLASDFYSKYIGFFNGIKNLVIEIKEIIKNPNSTLSENAGTGRFGIFKQSLINVLKNPIFGNGDTYTNPHSFILQIAEIWGIPCLTMLTISVIIVFVKFFTKIKHLSRLTIILACVCISHLFTALFISITPHIGCLFLMVLGIFYRFLNVDIAKYKMQKSITTHGIVITDQNVLN